MAHAQLLSGLTASTSYHYRVLSKDAAGNLALSGDYTFTTAAPPDITPPLISGVVSSSITATSAAISWTTNEASNSQIQYGTTTSYGASTTLATGMVTAHSQSLSGLTASTSYHYRVLSKDAAGNLAISGDYTFTTLSSIDITSGLVAAFAFDEGMGTIGADVSGQGNNASLISTTWTQGIYGQALSFDGISSYALAGTSGFPGGNALVAPFLWTYTSFFLPSTVCSSSFATL